MRKKGIVLIVLDELDKRNIEVSYDIVTLIINLTLEIIKNETSKGVIVEIKNFGQFIPHIKHWGNRKSWSVKLQRCSKWRDCCIIGEKKGARRMEKYGVEINKKDAKTKEAAVNGHCPVCGAELSGNPPICPNHGSEPFERRPSDKAEKG